MLGALLVTAAALTGCGSDADRPPQFGQYVALGDSFTSGAGLPGTVRPDSVCGNTRFNYPHLVAKKVGARLTDVSCGGATTAHGSLPQAQGAGMPDRPPQLDALDAETDLVTVSLGANDFDWYFGLMFACTQAATSDPLGNPCSTQASGSGQNNMTELPQQIGQLLEGLLMQVHAKAPSARVLVVGYPQLVPAHGTCPQLPLAKADYSFVRAQWEAMADAMHTAAEAAGATYVDILGPSNGHDICAGTDAWLNGAANVPGVAAPYHPLVAGQTGVAQVVVRALSD